MSLKEESFVNVEPDKWFECRTIRINKYCGKWEIRKRLGGGYNGNIFNVVDSSLSDSEEYILKIPRENTSKEYFYSEIHNLLKLSGNTQIPAIVDYCDKDKNLFLVYKHIPGTSLHDMILKNNYIPLHDAIAAIFKLLDTVKYCHDKKIIHRDIKPANIICRNDDINDLVLIDFGLSVDIENCHHASGGTIYGNRSLVTPEFWIGDDKKNPVSDLTYICGSVFFYMLFGCLPYVMTDEDGNPHHKRERAIDIMSSWGGNEVFNMNGFFNKVFDPHISNRFQNIDEIKDWLNEISSSN